MAPLYNPFCNKKTFHNSTKLYTTLQHFAILYTTSHIFYNKMYPTLQEYLNKILQHFTQHYNTFTTKTRRSTQFFIQNNSQTIQHFATCTKLDKNFTQPYTTLHDFTHLYNCIKLTNRLHICTHKEL